MMDDKMLSRKGLNFIELSLLQYVRKILANIKFEFSLIFFSNLRIHQGNIAGEKSPNGFLIIHLSISKHIFLILEWYHWIKKLPSEL